MYKKSNRVPRLVALMLLFAAFGVSAKEGKITDAKKEAELYAQRSIEYRKKAQRKLNANEQNASDLMDKADDYIDGAETPAQVDPAIKLYTEATQLAPDWDRSWWGLATAYWAKAYLMPHATRAQKDPAFALLAEARKCCDRALKIDPMSVGGNYLLANITLTEGGMKNVVQETIILPEVFKLTDKVAEVDPYFQNGAVFRTYVVVIIAVPTWLSSSLGFQPAVILPYIDKGIEMEPNCFVNYISRVSIYQKLGDPESRNKALKDLDYVLTHNPDALKHWEVNNRMRQKEARKLWKEMTGKEYPAR